MANWLYKSRNRRIPTYTTLQEPSNHRWKEAPKGHTSIEGARWIIHIPNYITELIKGKKVLILDSGYATGETAKAIHNHLKHLPADAVKYACLVYVKPVGTQIFKPDFYAYRYNSSEFWYPWGEAS
ncbi:MAG: phosphoribosyltransferase domain-containing protein [Desulfuromonadales bacterium]|nr:phosphoribosyltransferase domain-containing protein [Desulfuromonadales bacterium]